MLSILGNGLYINVASWDFSDDCPSGFVIITATVSGDSFFGVDTINSSGETKTISASGATDMPSNSTLIRRSSICSMKPVPVMVIFVPPASLPLSGEILVMVGMALYVNVPAACCPSGLMIMTGTPPNGLISGAGN